MEDSDQLKVGDQVGTYRIVRKIGAGGMGEIYEAWEEDLNRRVAIKIIAQRALENESVVERFRAEGRALAKLSNPHIVGVYLLGNIENRPYIVMEYIEGLPLQDFLLMHSCGLRDLVAIFRQVVLGLAAAHQAGIVHRDLKPHNILVDEKFNAKLIDFGIAKVYSDQASLQTTANVFIGTINYSAPEVLKGRAATSTSDIFSLGLVLYYMMTGDTPFTGSSQLEVMEKVRSQELSFAKHLGLYFPDELKQIVAKMTAKEPNERYQSCDEILEALKKIPFDELPPELNVASYPAIEIKNKEEVQEQCRKDGFDDSEIRFIISIATDLEAKRESFTAEDSDKTVEIQLKKSIVISKASLVEAVGRFRLARSRLITKQISKDKLLKSTTEKKALAKPSMAPWIAVACLTLTGLGIFGYHFLKPKDDYLPKYKTGDFHKLRKRRFHKPDPTYQNTSIDVLTVVKTSPDRVTFKNSLGDIAECAYNVFVPCFYEKSTFDKETPWVETNTIYGEIQSFFPLKVGKKAKNRVVGNRVTPNLLATDVNRTYQFEYTCEVIAREVVKIEIGARDTYKVKCVATGSFNFERILNYDPKLRRIVLMQQDGIDPYFEELIGTNLL